MVRRIPFMAIPPFSYIEGIQNNIISYIFLWDGDVSWRRCESYFVAGWKDVCHFLHRILTYLVEAYNYNRLFQVNTWLVFRFLIFEKKMEVKADLSEIRTQDFKKHNYLSLGILSGILMIMSSPKCSLTKIYKNGKT